MRRALYIVYSVKIKGNLGVGRMTIDVELNIPINFTNIKLIEELCLERIKVDHPTAENLFLTDWKFIEPEVVKTEEGETK